jgi:hypothetical protein
MRQLCLAIVLVLMPVIAAAQGPATPTTAEPLPWIAVDARLGWPGLGEDALVAAGLGVPVADLPTRALTGIVGIHGYPLRKGRWKVGVGAELLMGRGTTQKKDADGEPVGDPVTRTLDGVSWQLSLNFGRAQGWSYVTVGSGPFTVDAFTGDGPGDAPGRTTLNAGGGARWFKWRHVGLNVDLRFYLTKAAEAGLISPAREAQRVVVISAGLTFK